MKYIVFAGHAWCGGTGAGPKRAGRPRCQKRPPIRISMSSSPSRRNSGRRLLEGGLRERYGFLWPRSPHARIPEPVSRTQIGRSLDLPLNFWAARHADQSAPAVRPVAPASLLRHQHHAGLIAAGHDNAADSVASSAQEDEVPSSPKISPVTIWSVTTFATCMYWYPQYYITLLIGGHSSLTHHGRERYMTAERMAGP